MKAAVFYSGKFGSTKQYSAWLGETLNIPVFNIKDHPPGPENFDLLLLGTSIIVGKPTLEPWLKKHWPAIRNKQVVLFSVSGTAPGHPDLEDWMHNHLGDEMMSRVRYVPLRGRLILSELPWWTRLMLKLASRVEQDPEASHRMAYGFDYMDRDSLMPIIKWYQTKEQTQKTGVLA